MGGEIVLNEINSGNFFRFFLNEISSGKFFWFFLNEISSGNFFWFFFQWNQQWKIFWIFFQWNQQWKFFPIFFQWNQQWKIFSIFFIEISSGIFSSSFCSKSLKTKNFTPDAPTDLGDFSFFALSLIECKRQITCYVGGGVKKFLQLLLKATRWSLAPPPSRPKLWR